MRISFIVHQWKLKIPVERGQIPEHRRIIQKKRGHEEIYSSKKHEHLITGTVLSYKVKTDPDNQVPRDLSPEIKEPEREADFRDG